MLSLTDAMVLIGYVLLLVCAICADWLIGYVLLLVCAICADWLCSTAEAGAVSALRWR